MAIDQSSGKRWPYFQSQISTKAAWLSLKNERNTHRPRLKVPQLKVQKQTTVMLISAPRYVICNKFTLDITIASVVGLWWMWCSGAWKELCFLLYTFPRHRIWKVKTPFLQFRVSYLVLYINRFCPWRAFMRGSNANKGRLDKCLCIYEHVLLLKTID